MKVLVCDDEILARERLRRLLTEAGVDTIVEADSGVSAIAQVRKETPEVVLLDIEMPVMNGLEVAQQLVELNCPPAIVFCTAYDEYALDAFKANAVDYLLKPVRKESLEVALERSCRVNLAQIKQLLEHQAEIEPEVSENAAMKLKKSHLSVKTSKGIELIDVKDIRLFKAEQKYVVIKTTTAEYLIDETLKELEQVLHPYFLRVHRSALVALHHVTSLEQLPESGWVLKLGGLEERVQVSRRHIARVRKCLKNIQN